MSVKETSIGHGSFKKVLRRKLTGPPHLLLGKSKRKDGGGSRSVRAGRHRGLNNSCSMTDISERSCGEQMGAEVAGKSTTEPQRQSGDNKEKKEEALTEKPAIAAKSPSIDQDEIVSDQSQFTQKLTTLKQLFSPSVICFTCSRKPGERDDCDEGEYHAVTFFNRQTRDSVDLTAQSAVKCSNSEIQQHGFAEHKSAAAEEEEERETIKAKTFQLFKRLITAPKYQSKAKSVAPDNSLQYDGIIPCSFKKQPKPFWRHRPKKPSPFFQERIGENKEYIEEETIVLANKHVDDHFAKSLTLSPYPENEVKCHCPEMLTVSVDVSAVTLEIKGSTETSEAAKTSHASNDMKVMVEAEGDLGEGLIGGEEIQMNPDSLEERCSPQNSMVSQGFGVCQNVDVLHGQQGNKANVTASEHPTGGEEIRLSAMCNSDSNTTHQKASIENGIDATASKIPETVTGEGAVTEDLHLDTSDDVQSCIMEQSRPVLKSCGDTFYVRMVHSEENAVQRCDKREIFLLETACSVVQVAIKAALDQFKDELMDSVTGLDH